MATLSGLDSDGNGSLGVAELEAFLTASSADGESDAAVVLARTRYAFNRWDPLRFQQLGPVTLSTGRYAFSRWDIVKKKTALT